MASPHITKRNSSTKEISALPDDLAITERGVEDYVWPISHKDLLDFGQELEHELSSFFKNYPDQDKILPYKIASKNYVTTICGCFQGEFLAYRLKQYNLTLKMPDSWQVWPNIFSGLPLPTPAYLKPLYLEKKQDGLAHKIFQKILNPSDILKIFKNTSLKKGKGLSIDGLKIGKPQNNKLQQVIISTQRLPLISRHSQTTTKDVHLHPSVNWFEKITKHELQEATKQHDTLIDRQIIEIIKKLYAKRDIELSQINEDYLLTALKEFISLINIHMNRLSQREDIPHTIWTGTGGHMWDIMLRSEVKRRGRKVIAHDHGGGVPHLDHPEKGWIEMWACDQFVTYSKEQVKTFNMFKDTWPNLDKDLPEIISLPSEKKEPNFKTYKKFSTPNPEIKKIRIFSTIYSSEEGRGLPIYPHIPYIDWQTRLISYLKKNQYDVSFKPHPDSRLPVPKSYEHVLKADIIEKSLESMEEDFDLYIFDLSNTSVLQTALFTNKPVLIVDFSVMEWRQDAFELFKKRCGYVKGFYEDSRMCIDWNELTKQIDEAATKSNNHEFSSTYYF